MRPDSRDDRLLGLDQDVTRRDFLNAVLVGAGSGLVLRPRAAAAQWDGPGAEDLWYGYGGVGDYAPSHGNTPEVVRVAHEMRDGRFDRAAPRDTGEVFDLVIVGGGFAGLAAAHHFHKTRRPGQTCLVLENHPIFGGEAKQNEFEVGGERLIGPQGSNAFVLPAASFGAGARLDPHRQDSAAVLALYFDELGIPRDFEYQAWSADRKPLRFATDNYGFMLWTDDEVSVGHFFDGPPGGEARWVKDLWASGLEGAPFSEPVRKDLLRWRTSAEKPYAKDDFGPWLDGMSYKDFLEKTLALRPEVTAYADPILAAAVGLGCDAISAYGCLSLLMPGVKAFAGPSARYPQLHSFPGGNDGFARYFVKAIVPAAIPGDRGLADVLNRRVDFSALDRAGEPVRIRLRSTVVRVEHEGDPARAEHVLVTCVRGGQLERLRARAVVMATGSWVNRQAVAGLPSAHAAAFLEFHHSAVLVANVALTNWRFLDRLGLTACRWSSGFGFSCNVRRPMLVGDYRPPLDPDRPTVLTFYVPLYYPGLPIAEQGARGRSELLGKSFADYEREIRAQMARLFGGAGFDARRDVAGIILNRWGHAYVNPQPGFYFGRSGRPAARDVVRERFGRIAFGHSELEGHQNWPGAVRNGVRAARQVLEL
jgi:spermidine dehydrogenase